jgi:hypothetical protein
MPDDALTQTRALVDALRQFDHEGHGLTRHDVRSLYLKAQAVERAVSQLMTEAVDVGKGGSD